MLLIRVRGWLNRRVFWLVAGLVVVAGAVAAYFYLRGTPLSPACVEVVAAGANLLPNAELAAGADGAVASWVVSGTLAGGSTDGRLTMSGGTDLISSRVRVWPGELYCYQVLTGGSGHAQVMIHWDDVRLNEIGRSDNAPDRAGRPLRGEFVAPEGSLYARVRLRAIDGEPAVQAPLFHEAGARLEPWPGGARAALAFSFDWESAMGFPIHSHIAYDPTYAEDRGLKMRQGTDLLLEMFAAADVKATFYSTGYNLLDGNEGRRTFSGDPYYRYDRDEGWTTTWWLTNTWYSDDPYGSVSQDPAWYFGDQTDRLAAAGHEIASHTFGHFYSRAITYPELVADSQEWAAAATARGLPPARSFAFPYRASNGLISSFYDVLADFGFDSITRVNLEELRERYLIYASPLYLEGEIAVVPDFLLGAEGEDTGEGGGEEVSGGVQARAIIAEAIGRGGMTSFWTHPHMLLLPAVEQAWSDAIAFAVEEREAGRLWVATVGDIVRYWRDIGQVKLTRQSDTVYIVANRSPDPIEGVTLSLLRPAASVSLDGAASPQGNQQQIVLPRLAVGQEMRVEVSY